MFGVTTSDDYRPVAWMGRYPVDVTTMLVGLHVAMAVLGAVLVAIGAGSVLGWLQFDSAEIWYGAQVWRIFTYAFVHAPSALLWFAIEMYLLFVFGREVERFIGRRSYIAL
jgi:membrane associated rhomboid family serine protease